MIQIFFDQWHSGIAGLSVVADSLSAIKYAKVKQFVMKNGISC